MLVADPIARSIVDRRESEALQARTEADVRRLIRAVERIKRMTHIYQERLEGRRGKR